MRLLHVNTHDSGGGAAIAAHRLHLGLRAKNVDSRMAVVEQSGNSEWTSLLGGKVARRVFRPLLQRLEGKLAEACQARPEHPAYTTFSLFPSFWASRINALKKDLLHLHWVGEGLLTPWALSRLRGPVIWTMHDTWPFTGGCHFTATACKQYIDSCGQCPELCSKREYDLSRLHWLMKRYALQRISPVFVSPSTEYAHRAATSSLLKACRIEHIPNCIDTNVFHPISREIAREILGLPQKRPIIAFGAVDSAGDYNKGGDILRDTISALPEALRKTMIAAVFGSGGDFPFLCQIKQLGFLHDTVALRLAYSCADVFVCPSRQENFPNVILEALACGTPVAAFAVGGIPDMVKHGVSGWLATPHDSVELARGIAYIFEDGERRVRMGEAARRTVENSYTTPIIAQRYMALYEDVLERHRAKQA